MKNRSALVLRRPLSETKALGRCLLHIVLHSCRHQIAKVLQAKHTENTMKVSKHLQETKKLFSKLTLQEREADIKTF